MYIYTCAYVQIYRRTFNSESRGTPAIEDVTQFNGDVKRLRIEIQEGHAPRRVLVSFLLFLSCLPLPGFQTGCLLSSKYEFSRITVPSWL